MEIKPTYVTFEQAKWFKEKGFEEHSDYNQWILAKDVDSKDESKKFICHSNDLEEYTYINEEKEHNVYHCLTIPEQWQVIEWLRVEKGIWVSVAIFVKRDETVVWVYDIYKNNYIIEQFQRSKGFNSPQEAYSAAFDYILNNLI